MAARAYAFKGEITKLMVEYLGDQAAVFEAKEALQEAIKLQNSAQHTLHDVDVQGMLEDFYRS
jgi:succinate dehydrogenase/fumarate reductase flavoprotein subunit